jgi:hypothetical protein
MTFNGFVARLQAITHKIFNPKHKVIWRTRADEVCSGDIVCETCDRIYWCRSYR